MILIGILFAIPFGILLRELVGFHPPYGVFYFGGLWDRCAATQIYGRWTHEIHTVLAETPFGNGHLG